MGVLLPNLYKDPGGGRSTSYSLGTGPERK